MHFDTFKRTVDQIRDYCIWLSLYSWGEPFLNKEIDKYVAYAHDADIATIISSNLNKPLTPGMAERLIRSGLDVLIISLDGTTQEVYEVYRVGGYLDRVLDNVKLLVEKRKELGYTTPRLEWQFIVMRQNEHQISEARRMARELGVDDIVFKKVDFPFGEDNKEEAERWLPRGANGARSERPLDIGLRRVRRTVLEALAQRRRQLGRRLRSLLLSHRRLGRFWRRQHPVHQGDLEQPALPHRPRPLQEWERGLSQHARRVPRLQRLSGQQSRQEPQRESRPEPLALSPNPPKG